MIQEAHRSLQNASIEEYKEWQSQMDFYEMNLSDYNSTKEGIVHSNPYELRYGIPATIAMM